MVIACQQTLLGLNPERSYSCPMGLSVEKEISPLSSLTAPCLFIMNYRSGEALGGGGHAQDALPDVAAHMLPRPLVPPKMELVLRSHQCDRGDRRRQCVVALPSCALANEASAFSTLPVSDQLLSSHPLVPRFYSSYSFPLPPPAKMSFPRLCRCLCLRL